MTYESLALTALVLSFVNFLALPILIAKLFFYTHKHQFVTVDQHRAMFPEQYSPTRPSPQGQHHDHEDASPGSDIEAMFRSARESAQSSRMSNRVFPDLDDPDLEEDIPL